MGMTNSMIQIQDAYISRLAIAKAKMGKQASGLAFNRSKRAARKEATAALLKIGYSESDAAFIIRDAHDMFWLEANAQD
jgi:hypothetical protein